MMDGVEGRLVPDLFVRVRTHDRVGVGLSGVRCQRGFRIEGKPKQSTGEWSDTQRRLSMACSSVLFSHLAIYVVCILLLLEASAMGDSGDLQKVFSGLTASIDQGVALP